MSAAGSGRHGGEPAGERAGPALLARKTWRTLEPLHGMVYFVPEAAAAYRRLGVTGEAGYFASRAAPMGAVGAEVVVSTFYSFCPELVRAAVPGCWEAASPADLVAARLQAVDASWRRLLGEDVLGSGAMLRAARLARQAAEVASDDGEGRPVAAALADLPWPSEAHLVLWHAQTILREYRGDGHVALLMVHGLSGLEALVTHAAAGDVPPELLRRTRGWSTVAWDESVQALVTRGWLEPGGDLRFTAWGAAQRRAVEDGTDELAVAPYATLGDEACAELRSLARPWSSAFAPLLGARPAA